MSVNNYQPSLVLTQAIATQGIFPSRDFGGGYSYLATIHTFAFDFAPSGGSLSVNGQLLPIAQNQALFSLLGTMYGGNGQSNFALPDLGGRLSVNFGQAPDGSLYDQGSIVGTNQITLMQQNLTAASGGFSSPVDNLQETQTTHYAINYTGIFPSPDSGGALNMIGVVQQFAGNFAPGGTIECDGRLLSIAEYETLFYVIGTTYGGDGVTTFAVPDLRGRTIVGAGNGNVVGETLGNENATITQANMPTQMGGSGVPIDNHQPSLVMTQMIATQGIFPSRDGGLSEDTQFLGEVVTFAGNFVPKGFASMEGQLLSIAQNQALFALLGTNYGGNGTTTFALPDLRGRAVLGSDDTHQVGEQTGSATMTIEMADIPALNFSGSGNLYGGNLNDTILGSAGEDHLYGNGGSDQLDGGAGADTIVGGLGDDTFYVDNIGDIVTELSGEGADTVSSNVTYSVETQYVENLTLTGSGNINATGNDALNNLLIGNSGNNVLNGLAGADNMQGGLGDDIYYVDNVGDQSVEANSAGNDKVFSNVTYSVATQYIEQLELTGVANINAIGNALNNTLIGNSGHNTLNGSLGADTMQGGLGDDIYIVDYIGDLTIEASDAGTDKVFSSVTYNVGSQFVEQIWLTGSANINTTGNGQNNMLIGNTGNNTLNGGAGVDNMQGGLGDDLYFVDNVSDVVVEANGAGTDQVFSSVTHSLGNQFVEQLWLTGSDNINATGNSLNNVLGGNNGNNVLNGGAGVDTMQGGLGNDSYFVDNSSDVIVEAAGAGIDTIYSNSNFVASENVEHLVLADSANINATGNSLANVIKGNTGVNILDGQGGSDFLVGGAGSDTALYQVLSGADARGGNGSDTWTDFTLGDSTINTNADKVDIGDLLVGYSGDGSLVSLEPYLTVNISGSNTTVLIDRDGAGAAYTDTLLLTLNSVNTSLLTLINNHQFII